MSDAETDENAYLRTAFLKRVAHELRGPAGVIHSVLQELEVELGQLGTEQQRLLLMARRGVQRIVRTADRLQETGQLEGGEVRFAVSRWDVGALTRKAVTDAIAVEGRRAIEVGTEIPQDPVDCEVDARWLSTAIYELASNAIRHARARVHARVGTTERGDCVEVVFTDDSPATSEFEPARFRPRRPSRGLGLALAIVRDVATAHDGGLDIDVGSASGQDFGARVRLWLPRSSQRATRPTHEHSVP